MKSSVSRASANSARTSHSSTLSNISAISRRRLKAELELERPKVEEEEEAHLAELTRSLAEARRALMERRREREMKESMARLQLSDGAWRAPAPRSPSPRGYASEPDEDNDEDCPAIRQGTHEAWQCHGTRHDAWIDGLKQRTYNRTPAPPRHGSWSVYGAGQTCSKPFDGDPREWPLFISRFRALVHDAVPDDAQRVAILVDWLGPSVKRRVEALLTDPQGYGATLEYLRKQYGSPDKISRCRIADLLTCSPFPRAKSGI